MMKVLIAVLLALSFHLHADETLSVSQGWIPEAPPVARVMAGYLQIKNNSNHVMILKSISTNDFDRVEMHQTITNEGVASMVKQTSVEIPANGKVTFQRGGLHLMLIGPKRKLKRGDTVKITLKTDSINTDINLLVKEATLDDHSAHHHH